tara:strand:+ start:830 stop:988 length:159 start_codon:yes stop_codon:yes gene_type:complete
MLSLTIGGCDDDVVVEVDVDAPRLLLGENGPFPRGSVNEDITSTAVKPTTAR